MSAKDDTQEYINYLMQGSGASLDYEQLKMELNKDSISSAQAKTESSISAFHSYLKTQDLDPNISQIAQSAFRSSQTAKPIELKEPLGDRKPMNITDLEYSSPGSSPKLKVENVEIAQTETLAQLENLGKKLISNGFAPLHPTLMLATRDSHHIAGTLTDTQALYLISTLTSVITEYESRGTTIQNLVSQLNSRPISESESTEGLKIKMESQAKIIQKLEYEKKAMLLKEEANRARNASLLETIKQRYYVDSPDLEPILATVIESYEQKLESKGENYKTPFNPQASSNSLQELINTKKLEDQIQELKHKVLKAEEERDVLSLKLINQEKFWNKENDIDNSDSHLSTREKIQRDKMMWKSHGTPAKSQINGGKSSSAVLKEVCKKLGITDYENIPSAVEKIQMAFRLIPQMEKFITEVNATILAYNENMIGANTSRGSRASSIPPQKLSQSLDIIREWASMLSSSKEQQQFIVNVHQRFNIPNSPGSLEVCKVELEKLISLSKSASHNGLTPDISQQAITHLMNLFAISTPSQVEHKINEIYVFWAEVNDGLIKLKEALDIDKNVQPGRVLTLATQAIELSAKSHTGTVGQPN